MSNAEEAQKAKTRGNTAFGEGNHAEAVKCFTEAIDLEPNNHVFYSNRSAAYTSLDNFTEAINDANKCISLKADWGKGYTRLGTALSRAGRHSEAVDAYSKGLVVEPNSTQLREGLEAAKLASKNAEMSTGFGAMFAPENLKKLGDDPRTASLLSDPSFMAMIEGLRTNPASLNIAMQDSRMKLALEVLLGVQFMNAGDVPKEEVKPKEAEPQPEPEPEPIDPVAEQAEAMKQQGNGHYRKKEFDEALTCYSKALELVPTSIIYRLNRASVYIEQGDFDKAIAECQEAVDVGRRERASFGDIAKSYARMGNAYMKKEEIEAAVQAYNKSLAEHRDAAVLKRRDEAEHALKVQKEQQYIDPELSQQHKKQGNEYFKGTKYPEAVSEYTEAIKRNPTDHVLYSNRAACYTKLLAYPEALRDADECIKLDPMFVKGYTRKGHVLFFMKKYKEALETYDAGLKIDPNNAELTDGANRTIQMINRGIQEAQTGDREEVLQKAAQDPEVVAILNDPVMKTILEQITTDPHALQSHMQNPMIRQKIEKLVEVGVLRTSPG